MFDRLFGPSDLAARAEAMRRLHSEWLTEALRARSDVAHARIPTRLVSEGGFTALMSTPEGREMVGAFWRRELEMAESS